MDVLATGNDLGETGLDMSIVGAALRSAVDDGGQEALFACGFLGLDLCFPLCDSWANISIVKSQRKAPSLQSAELRAR